MEPSDLKGKIPAGPNPVPYLEAVDRYAKAGFDHVALHQIGQDQAGFIEFARTELLRC